MCQVDLYSRLGSYNMAEIYLQETADDPALQRMDLPVNATNNFILGRYFADRMRHQLLEACHSEERVISVRVHRLIGRLIAYHQLNTVRFRTNRSFRELTDYRVQDRAIELNFHDHPFFRGEGLRDLVSVLCYEKGIFHIDMGEILFAHIEESVFAQICQGALQMQLYLPARVMKSLQYYRQFYSNCT